MIFLLPVAIVVLVVALSTPNNKAGDVASGVLVCVALCAMFVGILYS